MKQARNLSAIGWGMVCGLGLVTVSQAADPVKVAAVDQQAVVERTVAGKRAMETLKEFSMSRQRILTADNDEIQGIEKSLRESAPTLSETAKRDKQEQFRAKYEGYQRRVQDFQREVQAKQKEMDEEYQKKIKDVVTEVAQKQGFTAVLDKGSDSTLKIVIYAQPTVDLTDAVIKEFDRRYK